MRRALLFAAVALAACGSSDDPPPQPAPTELVATGPVALTAREAIALSAESDACVTGLQASLVVQATAGPGRCALVSAGAERGGERVVTFELSRFGGTGPVAIDAGTYPVDAPAAGPNGSVDFAFASVTQVDAACVAAGDTIVNAVSGSIVLTSVSPTVRGTAELVLEGGGTLSGRFEAPRCASAADVCESLLPLEPTCQ